jgi:hypothetical protein
MLVRSFQSSGKLPQVFLLVLSEICLLVFGIAAKQVNPGCHYKIQIDDASTASLPFAFGRPSQFANAA